MVRDVSRLYPGPEGAVSGEEGPWSCHRPNPPRSCAQVPATSGPVV